MPLIVRLVSFFELKESSSLGCWVGFRFARCVDRWLLPRLLRNAVVLFRGNIWNELCQSV